MENKKAKESQAIPLKPYTTKELCAIYKVDRRTFKKWIKPFEEEIGERLGWYYTTRQVRIIFQKLDLPETFDTN